MLIALSFATLLAAGQSVPAADAPSAERVHFVTVGDEGPGMDKDGDGFVSREEFMAPLDRAFAGMDKDGDGRLSTDERADGHGPGHHRIEMLRGPGAPDGEHEVIIVRADGDEEPHVTVNGRAVEGDERNLIVRRMETGGPGERNIEIVRSGDGPRHGGPRIMLREREPGAGDGEREVIIVRADGEGDARVTVNGQVVEGDDRNVFIRRMESDGPGERFSFHRREGGPGDREHQVIVRSMGGPDGGLDKDGDGKVSEEEFIAPMRDAFRNMDADRSGALEESEHGSAQD